jgi:hypothetical protein
MPDAAHLLRVTVTVAVGERLREQRVVVTRSPVAAVTGVLADVLEAVPEVVEVHPVITSVDGHMCRLTVRCQASDGLEVRANAAWER